ncbi:hypothetical protein [Anaerocolumna xylanovorans]|uniref:hypothetical protein n=1 Tax=Anaerocolumna xylanovorans TaxID=100134 RepID=UPI000935E830|nr:hypothetical protein [Anaerocolumna xylanovorans]
MVLEKLIVHIAMEQEMMKQDFYHVKSLICMSLVFIVAEAERLYVPNVMVALILKMQKIKQGGTIMAEDFPHHTCTYCGGSGQVTCEFCGESKDYGYDVCNVCNGTGNRTCPSCDGHGFEYDV